MLMTDLTPADLDRLEKIARRRDADHLWDGMSPLHAELDAAKVLALVALARKGLACSGRHKPATCPRGHAWSPENELVVPSHPSPRCRACWNARQRAAYAKGKSPDDA